MQFSIYACVYLDMCWFMHIICSSIVADFQCRIMEVLLVQAKAYLGTPSAEGYTPLHFASVEDNARICSLLAAEVCMQCSLFA